MFNIIIWSLYFELMIKRELRAIESGVTTIKTNDCTQSEERKEAGLFNIAFVPWLCTIYIPSACSKKSLWPWITCLLLELDREHEIWITKYVLTLHLWKNPVFWWRRLISCLRKIREILNAFCQSRRRQAQSIMINLLQNNLKWRKLSVNCLIFQEFVSTVYFLKAGW